MIFLLKKHNTTHYIKEEITVDFNGLGIEDVIEEITDAVCKHYGINGDGYGRNNNAEIPKQTIIKI